MSRKSVQLLMCAAVAAALGMFGTAAQATFYTGTFDPPVPQGHFVGDFELNVHDGCSIDSCIIDLVSLSITSGDALDMAGHTVFTAGMLTNIAPSGASFDGGLNFTSDPIFLTSVSTSLFRGVGVNAVCDPTLTFNAGADGKFVANIESTCTNQLVVDTATYAATAVPEPATLALILGGIGAGWLTRRRQSAA